MLSLLRLRILIVTLVLIGLTGCTTTPKSTAAVHVQVSAGGVVTCLGAHFSAEQLPAYLAGTGVNKSQEIRVHMEDIHNTRMMSQIYNGLHSNGYVHILFMDEPRAVSEVIGDPKSRTEAPAGNNTSGSTPSRRNR